jgi:hypothetical protein
MWVDWEVCDNCWETYPDCWEYIIVDEDWFTLCEGCMGYYWITKEDKDEEGYLKKELYKIEEEVVVKTEKIFTFLRK